MAAFAMRGHLTGLSYPRHSAFLFLGLYFSCALMLALPALSYPWFLDDLHLIRPHSWPEISQAWRGNWDFSGIETPGYRPLTVLFNHSRAVLLGENLPWHRLSGVLIFSGYLTLFSLLAVRIGWKFPVAAAAGLLTLFAKYNCSNLVWITDFVRPFGGILMTASVHFFLTFLEEGKKRWAVFTVVAALAGLLMREETAAWILFMPLAGALKLFSAQTFSRGSYLRLGAVSCLLAAIAAAYFSLRNVFVPEADGQFNPLGAMTHFYWSFFPAGLDPQAVTIGGKLFAVGAALVMVVKSSGGGRVYSAAALTAAAIFSLPGMFSLRTNNVIFSLSFTSLFFAGIFAEMADRFRALKMIVPGAFLFLLALCGSQQRNLQEFFHPGNIDTAYENIDFLAWSKYVVPVRREFVLRHAAAILHPGENEDYETAYQRRRDELEAGQHFKPDAAGFVAQRRFLAL